MSTGRSRTLPLAGVYWISSATSSRSTTAPGVRARSRPTCKACGSAIEGMPPLCRRSPAQLRTPRVRLRPPVSTVRLIAAGFPSQKLVGATALVSRVTANRALSGSLPDFSASSTSRSIDSVNDR